MRIAFDAKRAFQNHTGLGHYSRTLLSSLMSMYPEHEYYLMAPKVTDTFSVDQYPNAHIVSPTGMMKNFRSVWRSDLVKKDLKRLDIELYHGLSHELPIGIHQTNIRAVVTIHDLIFERYPAQFGEINTNIYRRKFKYACRNAHKIIAISEQTKADIVNYYKIDADRIAVCYQACNSDFEQIRTSTEKEEVRARYKLPQRYFLSVGSIIERKNLLTICKALQALKGKLDIPLVVVGDGGAYKRLVKQYILRHGVHEQVIFLSEQDYAANEPRYKNSADLPAIYQMATALIYPSIFEGFGLPVLEALWSEVPVITSDRSSLVEAGGDAALLVNPDDKEAMADAMYRVATNESLRKGMIERGIKHAQKFDKDKCAAAVMDVYKSVLH